MKSATKIFIKIRTITDDEIIGNLKNFNNNLIDLSDAYFVTNPKLIFPTLVIRMEDSLKISEIQENEGFFIDGDFMGKKEDKKSDLVHFECKNGESESFNVKESKNWDQFKANEQLFGIKSSFDESQYTVVLDKNSEFYKKNVEHAKKLAQEILSKKCTDRHRMEERGHFYDINEEEKYSSVLNDRKKRNGLIKKKETFRKESLRNGESKDYPHRPSSPIKENFRKESTRNGESKDYPHRPSSPIKENFKKESTRNGESKDYPHRPSSPIKENFKKESTRNVELKDYPPHGPSSPIKENFKKEESMRNVEIKDYPPHRLSSPTRETIKEESTKIVAPKNYSTHRPSSPIRETFKKENIKILESKSSENSTHRPSSPIKEKENPQINSDSKSSDKSISSLSTEKEEITVKDKISESMVPTKKISYGKPISRTFKNFKTFIEAVTSKFTYSFKPPTSWGCGEHYTEYKENKSESAVRPSIIGYGYSNYRKK
ncbi:hypothetical protein LUQ84_000812 [Hamiltosporidium tvaerminnensis]|nr:hypothetical protein LUQ84_000812 [Hamiltosporidium tvaerminnensis]